MFEKLKVKWAARRMNKGKAKKSPAKKKAVKKTGFWSRVWKIICMPFKWVWKQCKRVWAWIKTINLIGLINLTLLIAIIVLFTMLIIDVMGCRKQSAIVVVQKPVQTEQVVTIDLDRAYAQSEKKIRESARAVTLPIKEEVKTNASDCKPATEVKTVTCGTASGKFHGDMIIDGFYPGESLSCGQRVRGNVYLQNMRKYTLPCNTVIEGNLLLRNVDMVKFCGTFTVTGNIYVHRNSSFGPIPKTARIGGQVIL